MLPTTMAVEDEGGKSSHAVLYRPSATRTRWCVQQSHVLCAPANYGLSFVSSRCRSSLGTSSVPRSAARNWSSASLAALLIRISSFLFHPSIFGSLPGCDSMSTVANNLNVGCRPAKNMKSMFGGQSLNVDSARASVAVSIVAIDSDSL